jgi:ribose transport system ATP-binding protein
LYILDEPTVGVDIGAKTEIYRIIGELASQGAVILVLSSDLLELLGLTDRILVFFHGKVVRELDASATDSDALLSAVTAVDDQKPGFPALKPNNPSPESLRGEITQITQI